MATQTTTAAFNGAQPLDGDFPYVDITFATAYDDEDRYAEVGGVAVDSGGVAVWVKESSRTGTGLRLLAADQFTGTVRVITVDI